jgi:type II secretion system protein G
MSRQTQKWTRLSWAMLGGGAAVILSLAAGCGGGGPSKIDRVNMADRPEILMALGKFERDCGRLPTEQEGLKALVTKPASPDIAGKWAGPYIAEARLKDPWGTPYLYGVRMIGDPPMPMPGVWSAGPDKTPNTEDDVTAQTSAQAPARKAPTPPR